MTSAQKLKLFLEQHHPHIRCITPESPDYAELREAFVLDNPTVPLAIVRPQTAEDVSALVNYACTEGIAITVRTGGHDLYGRCYEQDALAIDMRDISFVRIDDNKTSATIGGGTLAGAVATALMEKDLITPFGFVSTVGYVGWATHGGYGQFAANYGLGVDQILGAKVVNHEGKIVEADEEMLSAIRGGGGTLGVIVEMTIRVYALEKVLGGVLVYDSTDIISTINKFSKGYQAMEKRGLPSALGIQRSIANTPMGQCFLVGFMWSSPDLDEGRRYLEEICSLGTVIDNGVRVTSVPTWQQGGDSFCPKAAHGGICNINVRGLTDEVNGVVAASLTSMPADPCVLLSFHQLRGPSARPKSDSVFAARTPHYMIEIIGMSLDAEAAKKTWNWALELQDALRRTNAENILPLTYIALTSPKEATLERCYGDNWRKLVGIKMTYDYGNVFKHALPTF